MSLSESEANSVFVELCSISCCGPVRGWTISIVVGAAAATTFVVLLLYYS